MILYCVNLCGLPINVLAFLHVIIQLQSNALCTLLLKYFSWYANQMFDDDFVHQHFGEFLTMSSWSLHEVKELELNTSYK